MSNSGIYFRVFREGGWHDLLFEQLTIEEKVRVLDNKDDVYLKSLAIKLAGVIKDLLTPVDPYDDPSDDIHLEIT